MFVALSGLSLCNETLARNSRGRSLDTKMATWFGWKVSEIIIRNLVDESLGRL